MKWSWEEEIQKRGWISFADHWIDEDGLNISVWVDDPTPFLIWVRTLSSCLSINDLDPMSMHVFIDHTNTEAFAFGMTLPNTPKVIDCLDSSFAIIPV